MFYDSNFAYRGAMSNIVEVFITKRFIELQAGNTNMNIGEE